MADADIDLYADVEGDFAGEDFGNDSRDLYDDVLSHSKEEKPGASKPDPLSPPAGASSAASTPLMLQQPGRKFQLYVGNLTWWTTDNDIQVTNLFRALGRASSCTLTHCLRSRTNLFRVINCGFVFVTAVMVYYLVLWGYWLGAP